MSRPVRGRSGWLPPVPVEAVNPFREPRHRDYRGMSARCGSTGHIDHAAPPPRPVASPPVNMMPTKKKKKLRDNFLLPNNSRIVLCARALSLALGSLSRCAHRHLLSEEFHPGLPVCVRARGGASMVFSVRKNGTGTRSQKVQRVFRRPQSVSFDYRESRWGVAWGGGGGRWGGGGVTLSNTFSSHTAFRE